MARAVIIGSDPHITPLLEFLLNRYGFTGVASFAESTSAVEYSRDCGDVALVIWNRDGAGTDNTGLTMKIREIHPPSSFLLLSKSLESIGEKERDYPVAVLGECPFAETIKKQVHEALECRQRHEP